jgi:hypothetical protein
MRRVRAFRAWVNSLWFAPNRLAREASAGRIDGMYVPYWTFDAATTSQYTGQRGDDYTVTEEYRDSSGALQTRSKTETRWTSVRGTVTNSFDDVLVVASRSLPEQHADALRPWDLEKLVPYRDEFLAGFGAETYQVGLPEAYEKAKTVMAGAHPGGHLPRHRRGPADDFKPSRPPTRARPSSTSCCRSGSAPTGSGRRPSASWSTRARARCRASGRTAGSRSRWPPWPRPWSSCSSCGW